MVQHPPAFCPTHGLFAASAFGFEDGAANISIKGISTNCPVCGANSEIIPGRYDAKDDTLNVLLDPSISADALNAIRQLVTRLQAGEVTVEQAKKQLENISPKASRLFDISEWSDQAKATLFASIIGAIAIISAARLSKSSGPTININPVVERVVAPPKTDFLSSSSLRVPLPKPNPLRPKRDTD
jgi:hypothetical protein